jgi:hypothetical protein
MGHVIMKDYQGEVEALHKTCRDAFEGHSNQVVLHALGCLLFDSTDPAWFEEELSRAERIDRILALMRDMLNKMQGL